ncbi:hypothetical protein DLAC_10048 [Tieghemostelium lacteum]|uniref:Uncharacterized protein n=1 Tax=Tieghemostelium lacteum TaxID=361077 RepID=A0A151Z622_TIELA|nr:hypothetical protein DLAC_10048 [Tieghemostelium lacteum]|eukprot:KYQ89388.1 hypothetical protein DLAC_10048 [Tieghemostelium lacteum]
MTQQQQDIQKNINKMLTGEIDGIKMTKLQMFHDLVLEKSLSEFPFEKFYECYSKLSHVNNSRAFLSYLYINVFQTLNERIKSDFQQICKERCISERLSELDQLIREQPILPQSTNRCPPQASIPPNEQTLSQVIELKLQEKERLSSIYQNLLADHNKLQKEIKELERQKTEVIDNVNNKIKSVSSIIETSRTLDS